MSSKPEAKDLSCFFAFFAKKHPNSDLLKHVEKCREGKWRNASATAAKTRITEMAEYFPELTSYLDSMESYSLCGGHYNRVIAKKAFINQLKKETDSILSSGEPEKKRLKFSNDDDKLKVSEKTFVDFGAQVDLFEKTFVDFGAQVDLCEKTCADFGSYVSFSDPMCEILQRRIDELEKNNKPLLSENEALKKKLSERFTNQQDRINSIIEIAQKERSNLYEDITNLMKNQERFCLDNLLKYSPSKWLAERNPVVVKFIETLTHNEGEHQHREEKLFKHAVAIDAIYGSRHLKYVSAINLATSAIKYSLARSKMIVDIDNHIISSGSYTKFNSWLESLAGEQLQLPEGFLFLAFDNEQKGQKNYLDRGHNTVIFHTVTSFVAFNYSRNNNIQSVNPWLYTELDQKQYEELFHLSSGELCVEKNQETNAIDELVHHQSQIGHMKKCTVCQTSNIDNKKRVCPECHNKLPTIAEIIDEQHKIINAAEKSTVISSYVFKQRSVPESEVHTPQIFVPDPIGINPNSIDNVRKVLEHIKEISGVKDDSRKWVVVTCDGVPYHHIQKMKKDFPWLILIPGALHEEMNMLKAFVELNWNIDIRDFAKCQGYRTENQLQFFKKCSDHHKSWDSICNIYRHAMVSELMWPYVISEENPSVEGYLKWAQNQTDHMFRLKYEQVFIYLQAIINFRTGVRFNRPLLRFAARRIFAPIWSARRHPIYRLIEVTDEEQMLRLKPEIRNLIQERIVTSRSKLSNQHQGHDAILEEINKSLKSLIPPIPSQRHWEIAARNCTKFSKLRTNIFNIIGYSESEVNEPRTRPGFTVESRRFRVQIRKANFVNPTADNRDFQNLGGELTLSEEMIRFSEIARMKRIEFIKAKLIEKTPLGIWRPIPVTCEEAELQKSESSLKKSQILSIINSLTPSLGDLDRSRFRGLSNKSREDLVDILQEIRNILAGNSIDANEV
ncbi:hypothetical protein C2G38_2147907 [Gigaspora rosea]|uniref:Uncharacterized protein n=1 Tax=Gigaspora rosea TaxID=44941 RepID=A0A397UAL2_9GLOM|nr:hypothetical protein C2G38_2147907 [Gigaspora rosea]